ncbi:response regulator [Desulfovibrio sp. UCD-KL4C]|uniref:response regulator n=1 Tax=Desulfovibrio sp. UCD-KL4C TaxID=2578120 RepID=UPI0025BBE3BC|nr:response regulator [Desulfovibrio sp. UCD-KL4C]
MKIMIVESDTEFRENLATRLINAGLKVFESDNLDEAKEQIIRNKLQIIVLGLSGFGRNSLAFMKTVSTIVPDLKIILITQRNTIPLSIEAMNLGACAEVPVPVDIAVLLKTLRSADNR